MWTAAKYLPVSLTGTTLRFDRRGARVVAVDTDSVSTMDVATSRLERLPYAGVRAAAELDGELWLVTREDQLLRVDLAGRAVAAPVDLPFADRAVLVPAPCGRPAAIWAAAAPVVLTDDGGTTELADVDTVIPLTGTRLICARGSRVVMSSGLRVDLAPGSKVVGGCVTADGKLLALVVEHTCRRELVVLSMTTAQIGLRCALGPADTIAIGQAMAVIQVDARVLRVLDLRAMAELGTMTVAHDIAALAIDPTGRSLAIRSPGGEIEILQVHVDEPPVLADAPEPTAPVAPAVDDEVGVKPRLAFSEDGQVIVAGAAEPELVATSTDASPPEDLAASEPPATDSIESDARFGAFTRPTTTLDWIDGGSDHLGGYY